MKDERARDSENVLTTEHLTGRDLGKHLVELLAIIIRLWTTLGKTV